MTRLTRRTTVLFAALAFLAALITPATADTTPPTPTPACTMCHNATPTAFTANRITSLYPGGEVENNTGTSTGFAVMKTWKGTGLVYGPTGRGNYDNLLKSGQNSGITFGWADTNGFYVGVSHRALLYRTDGAGGYVRIGWFNRGQYQLNTNNLYWVDDLYNCHC